MKIIVGIPAFNEERTIAEVIAKCRPYQTIVLNNNSIDRTQQ